MKTNRILSLIIILIFSLVVVNSFAQDRHAPPQGRGHHIQGDTVNPPHPPQHGMPGMQQPEGQGGEDMEPGPQRLDLPGLSNDQRDRIKKADLKNMAEMTPLRNQLHEKKARLATLLTTMPFDQKQADAVAEDIGKTATSILKNQIRHDQELRAILTPDQQILFDARPKPWLKKRL